MTGDNKDFIRQIEKFQGIRLAMFLFAFIAGIFLIQRHEVRTAFLVVGFIFLVGGAGYIFAETAVLRAASAKTGKSIDNLRRELKQHLSVKNKFQIRK